MLNKNSGKKYFDKIPRIFSVKYVNRWYNYIYQHTIIISNGDYEGNGKFKEQLKC